MISVFQSLSFSNFLLPKRGHKPEECEDAIASNEQATRFAIADGATEAFDSGNWSRRLVSSWTKGSGLLQPDEFWEWIQNEGQLHCDGWANVELSWYAREKERAGSFAAFVGVELTVGIGGVQWNSIAIGDSCLLQTRNNEVVQAFPLSRSSDFGPAPVLAPSRTARQPQAAKEVTVSSGTLDVGDELLLVSDATAAWLIRLDEEEDLETRKVFGQLLDNEPGATLAEFLEQQRTIGRLKDDDVAIIRIKL